MARCTAGGDPGGAEPLPGDGAGTTSFCGRSPVDKARQTPTAPNTFSDGIWSTREQLTLLLLITIVFFVYYISIYIIYYIIIYIYILHIYVYIIYICCIYIYILLIIRYTCVLCISSGCFCFGIII